MAVAYDEGVIIGADSRTTMGSYIANRVTDKLTHITDRIYCCRSGSAADTQAVADAVTHHLSLVDVLHGPPEVSTAAHLFSEIVYQNKDRLSAGIIVARWDKRNGGTVYNVTLGGGLFQQPWAIGGWNRQQTVEFVTNALALAMRRDGSSGGTIRLADISEHGVERHFIPGDKLPELSAKLC
ncbi:unnamed protein product [Tilletia controversa]|nr:unnamed protein product [Tilletia controversa]CAD6908360.1 unnamed protein product [Tilletia controversa]CAD6983392.1 unnamed protein product [Tilletia controversa]CAD7060356.1 unnamed protein product [Tilletia caries]